MVELFVGGIVFSFLFSLMMAETILYLFVSSWVLSYLWLWFAVPLGAMELLALQIMGLRLIVGILTVGFKGSVKHPKSLGGLGKKVLTNWFGLFLVFLVAYLIKFWWM